jgi:hypothetical protein
MKYKLIAFLTTMALMVVPTPLAASASSTATVVAADSFRSVSGIGTNYIRQTATDAAGNLYVLGQANNNFTDMSGNQTVVFNMQFSQTDNIYLAKYSAAGVQQWVTDFGSTSNESVSALAVASDGTIAVSGRLCMNLVIAPSINLVPISQFCDPFFAVLDADGNGLWAKVFGEPNQFYPNQWVTNVAFDSAGSLYAAVYTSGMIDLATYGIDGTTFTLPGGVDYSGFIVVKYNQAQQLQWLKPLPDGINLNSQAFTVTATGDVLVGGYMNRAIAFDSLGTFTPTGEDGVLARISSTTRNFDNLKIIGGAGTQRITGIALTSSGSVVISSRLEGTGVLNSVSYASAGGADALIAKLSGVGWTTDWVTRFGGAGTESFFSAAVDSAGRIYTSGSFTTSVTLGGAGTFTASSSVGNGLVVGLEPDGSIAWAKQSSSPANGWSSLGGGVSVFGNSVYAAGQAAGTQTTIDGVSATGNAFNCCNGYSNGFFLKITTSAVGGAVVVNNVSQPVSNAIDVTRATPRVIDSPAAAFQQTISGRNLDKVTSVSIAGKQLKFELNKSGELVLDTPVLSVGSHNVLLVGTGFQYTLVSAIRVRDVQTVAVNRFNNLRDARVISAQVRQLQTQLGENHKVHCQLELSKSIRTAESKRQIKMAQAFCSALTVPTKLVVTPGGLKTQLSVVVRQN